MRTGTTIISLASVTLAVSGCGGSNLGSLPIAPYADTYKASYASSTLQKMEDLLKEPGDKVQGVAIPNERNFGSETQKSGTPQSVEIEKTTDGYIMRVAGEEVEFTQAELVNNNEYALIASNSQGQPRTIGLLFPMTNERIDQALSSSQTAMVPLGYGVRKNSEGGSVADGNEYFEGYAIAGLETDPSSMPKTGTASYSGFGRIEAMTKSYSFDNDDIEMVRYQGDATINADFGAGTVAGAVDLSQRRISRADSGNDPYNDISAQGAKLVLQETDIIGNGFSANVEGNAATETLMANDGISADTKAQAIGRFYGENASQVGAVISGEGSTHTVQGIVYADRN